MEERLDIFNLKGEKTSESETYENIHLRGLLHKTVHVWFLNSKQQFLLQKRANNKCSYPNYWDISAAGHIDSGETSLQGAKRETKEELGIDLLDSAFTLLTTIKQPITKHGDTFIDNEFNDVYLVHCDLTVSEFKLQAEEIAEVRWIDKNEFEKWIGCKGELLVPREEEYKILLSYFSRK